MADRIGIIPGTTICGLADGAGWPVKNAIRKFRQEFEDAIKSGYKSNVKRLPMVGALIHEGSLGSRRHRIVHYSAHCGSRSKLENKAEFHKFENDVREFGKVYLKYQNDNGRPPRSLRNCNPC